MNLEKNYFKSILFPYDCIKFIVAGVPGIFSPFVLPLGVIYNMTDFRLMLIETKILPCSV